MKTHLALFTPFMLASLLLVANGARAQSAPGAVTPGRSLTQTRKSPEKEALIVRLPDASRVLSQPSREGARNGKDGSRLQKLRAPLRLVSTTHLPSQ